jgi:hypothetical protein
VIGRRLGSENRFNGFLFPLHNIRFPKTSAIVEAETGGDLRYLEEVVNDPCGVACDMKMQNFLYP